MRSALEAAAVRVAPSMNPQNVANTIWGLATLGWQAGEGPMRDALEAAAVRVAPSMKPQDVATLSGGWRRSDGRLVPTSVPSFSILLKPFLTSVGLCNSPQRTCRSFCRRTLHRSSLVWG